MCTFSKTTHNEALAMQNSTSQLKVLLAIISLDLEQQF